VFSAARRINDQEPRRFADRTVPQRDRNAKNFESANDIATAAEIPANNAISKDGKRRVSQTAAMFSNSGGNAAEDEPRKLAYIQRRFSAVYWMVAVSIRMFLLAHRVAAEAAEPGGILRGAGTMILRSYSGHRFFTYRTYQRAKHLDGRL